MARIAVVADVHLGNRREFGGPYSGGINERGRASLEALRYAVLVAKSSKCDAFLIDGDLFDSDRPEPQILKETLLILEEAPPVLVLLGNHEMRTGDQGDHSLGPLYLIADVIDRPQIVRVESESGSPIDIVAVPFRPGPAEEWLPEALSSFDSDKSQLPKILAIHLGISDNDTPSYMAASEDSIGVGRLRRLCNEHRIDGVVAGNWHEHEMWEPSDERVGVYQVGCLCPTDFRNPGVESYGLMGILEFEPSQPIQYRSIPVPGPRFLQVSSVDEVSEIIEANSVTVTRCYVELTTSPDQLDLARAELRDMEGLEVIHGFRVRSDGSEEIEAKSRVSRVRSSGTIEEALASFIQELVYTGSISKERLIEIAKEYLGL
jgi:DNA repair exonuclease SbcCD nuclease subunit